MKKLTQRRRDAETLEDPKRFFSLRLCAFASLRCVFVFSLLSSSALARFEAAPAAQRMKKPVTISMPDGSRVRLSKSLPKAVQPARTNPYGITLSFVATKDDAGVLYSTNGLAGLTITNANLFLTEKDRRMLKVSPILSDHMKAATMTKSLTLAMLPDRPQEGISWSPWDTGINVALIDTITMQAGKTYTLEASVDMVRWNGTGQSVTWTATDPTAYWRCVRAVPSDGGFVEVYRVVTP